MLGRKGGRVLPQALCADRKDPFLALLLLARPLGSGMLHVFDSRVSVASHGSRKKSSQHTHNCSPKLAAITLVPLEWIHGVPTGRV